MLVIYVLLSVFLPVVWLVGMIKPSLFSKILKSRANRKFISLICFILWMLDVVMIGIVSPDSQTENNNQAPQKQVVENITVIDTDKLSVSYEIVATKDMSHKAIGSGNLSDYSVSELQRLPTDKKINYKVVVDNKIKADQVNPTIAVIIKDITTKDKEVDEVIIDLYSDKAIIDTMYDVANAVWAPQGELGNVTADIAHSNDRSGYKTTITVKPNLEEYLAQKNKSEDMFGLSEAQRRQFFKEIIAAEDRAHSEADRKYSSDTLTGMTKNQEEYDRLANIYRGQVGKKYGITKDQEDKIVNEALKENWPL